MFIANAFADEAFVIQELLPGLENGPMSYKVRTIIRNTNLQGNFGSDSD